MYLVIKTGIQVHNKPLIYQVWDEEMFVIHVDFRIV